MLGITQDGTYRAETIGFSVPELTSGYVVGVRSVQHESDVLPGDLFGRWTDEDGTVYWDIVEFTEDRAAALSAALDRGEIAIWDVARGTAVKVAQR